ncbi:MAG TPA: energy transducer TonB [Terriglobales bacterium]|nr:energy transducer TonB [Terriglobales bacterium]
MFDDLVESSVVKKKTHTSWAIVVSTIVQAMVLIVLILIPLIYTQALPKAMMATLLIAPPPPPPPPPPPAEAPKVVKPVARLIQQGKLMQPRAIPKQVEVFKEAELPPEAPVAGGVLGGLDNGLLGGLGAGPAVAAPPPPPPAPKQTQRIKLGGQVVAAKLVAQSQPVYPPLARQARIQGNVVLHAIIDKDGRVGELQVISGHPLLVQSALEAVKNWRYQPTQLNGDPVEVDTTITVSFVLGG